MEVRIVESIRSAIRRPWRYVETSLRLGGEHFPMDDDPVGEFLERKKAGVNLIEEDNNEHPVESAVPKAPEASSESGVGKDTAQPVQRQAEMSSGAGLTGDVSADKLPYPGGDKVIPVISEAREVPVKAQEEPHSKPLELGAQSVEIAKSPQEKAPKDDKDTDSILEIFKSEDLALEPSTPLSKELRDMNVYSLLEESKKIASKVKFKRKPTESS